MPSYILRRLFLMIPTFLGITYVVYFILCKAPGGPLEQRLSQLQEEGRKKSGGRGDNIQLSPEQMAELRKYYGFSEPSAKEYFSWLGRVMTGDLGYSNRFKKPVSAVIFDKERIQIALIFGIFSFLIIYSVSLPMAVWKAKHHQSFFDSLSSMLMFAAYAIPGWVIGLMMILFFASYLDIFPIGGFVSKEYSTFSSWGQIKDIAWHMTLPLTAYVVSGFAGTIFLLKNSLMDNLAADYVRTALAKGNTFNAALWKHAFRNSIIPIAAGFGHYIGIFITGALLIEKIFNLNGFGKLSLTAVEARDYPLIMGMLVITSTALLLGNLLSDLCVAAVDPRVKFD